MSKKKVLSRMLSMMVVAGMLMVSVPDALVLADDDGRDTFIITEFQDLDTWKMEKTAYLKGTKVSDMEFPETWIVEGYLETEGSSALTEKKLEALEWVGVLKDQKAEKEKTDDPVCYTEKSEAGTYDFTVKLPDHMKTAKDTKIPKVQITIKAEGEEPKTEEPKTEEPKTEEPKTEEPKTEEPKTEEPKTEEPKTEEPKTEEPKTEEPKTEVPKMKSPGVLRMSGGKIQKFVIDGIEGVIDENSDKITVQLSHGISAADLAPEITVGADEKVSPASGEKQDFTNPVAYTVYAADGTELRTYQVEVKTNPHSWKEATCETPKTCTVCGKTEGEALGHSWKEATCEAPKTCTVCGKTEGEALGHSWKEATCETPKTCTVCGKTEGEALGHSWKEATCETPKTCTVCGKTEGEALGHSWKEATCETPKTCTVCGKTEGPALGHSWKEATCETPKTCTVCGKTEGPALGHSWKNADCTHPKTCTVCGKTEGQPLGHQWSEWVLTKKPTTDAQGLEERICVPCQLKETRQVQRLNRIGEARNNKVTGIKANGIYGVDEKITITAEGAWMDNKDPIKGDVRYVPSGWRVTSSNSFKDSIYQVTFKVKTEGNYTLQVYFQKQSFDGKQWINEKETDTRSVNFTISRNKAIPVKTGDDTMIAGWAAIGVLALAAMFVGIRQKRRSNS